jgi:hypothetical protein
MSDRHGGPIHAAPNHYPVFGLVHLAFSLVLKKDSRDIESMFQFLLRFLENKTTGP